MAEAGMNMPSALDDSAIAAALGKMPHTPLAQGVSETIERFQLLKNENRLDIADLDQ